MSPAGWSRRPAHPTRCPGAGPRAQGTQWGHSLQPVTGAASPCQHLPLLQVNTEQGHLSSAAARPGQPELHGAPGPCSPRVAVTSMGPSPQGDPRWRGRGWHRLSPLPAVLPPPPAAQTPAPLPPSSATGCRQKGSVGRVPDLRGHAGGPLPNIHHPRQGLGSPVTSHAAQCPHPIAWHHRQQPHRAGCCRDPPGHPCGAGAPLTRPLPPPVPLQISLFADAAPGRGKGLSP